MSVLPLLWPLLADLQQELALPRELQHVVSLVGRQPDVVFAVDRNAVHRGGPLVARARAAPRRHEIAGRIEFEHRRRDIAAELRDLALVAGLQRRGAARLLDAVCARQHAGFLRRHVAAMRNPDVIARIDAEADDRAHDPVVRQRLRPHRIDLIHRRLHGRARLRRGRHLQAPTGRCASTAITAKKVMPVLNWRFMLLLRKGSDPRICTGVRPQ